MKRKTVHCVWFDEEPEIDWAAVDAALHPRVWWDSASLNAGWGKPVRPAALTLEEARKVAL